MTTWEYKSIKTEKSFWGKDKDDIDQILNDQGRDGWELVSVAPMSQVGAGTTTHMQFFFK